MKISMIFIVILVITMVALDSIASSQEWHIEKEYDDKRFGCNVYNFEYDPDGSLIAMVYHTDGEIGRIIDLDLNLKTQLYSESKEGDAHNLRWSSDGTMLAVIGWLDGQAWDDLYIYDIGTGETLVERKGWSFDDAKDKSCLDFNSDDELLAVGGGTSLYFGLVEIFDVDSGDLIRTLINDFSYKKSYVTSISFSPDDGFLIAGDMNGNITVWDTVTWNITTQFKAHDDDITAIVFDPSENFFATSSDDGNIGIWRFSDWGNLQVLSGNDFNVSSVAWSMDGTMLATGSQSYEYDNPIGGEMIIWDTDTWDMIYNYEEEQDVGITKVDWNPSQNQLAIGTTDSELKIFEFGENEGYISDSNGKNKGTTGIDFFLYLITAAIIILLIVLVIIVKKRKAVSIPQAQIQYQEHSEPQFIEEPAICPDCNGSLEYSYEYQKWYCPICNMFYDEYWE